MRNRSFIRTKSHPHNSHGFFFMPVCSKFLPIWYYRGNLFCRLSYISRSTGKTLNSGCSFCKEKIFFLLSLSQKPFTSIITFSGKKKSGKYARVQSLFEPSQLPPMPAGRAIVQRAETRIRLRPLACADNPEKRENPCSRVLTVCCRRAGWCWCLCHASLHLSRADTRFYRLFHLSVYRILPHIYRFRHQQEMLTL